MLFAGALAIAPLYAQEIALDGAVSQGGLVQGTVRPGARVTLDGREIRVSREGVFVIGFGRDAPRHATLRVTDPDGVSKTRRVEVGQRKYKVQRIDGLPGGKVTPPPEALSRIRTEGAMIRSARGRDTDETWFRGGFTWPAKGRISGIYGSRRILNGKPRRPHAGVDVAAPTGDPVVAAGRGVVSLARTDLFFTGGTVMIDHGFGVSTIYAHMSAVDVKEGARVEKGARIGRIGATGRVTGAHLHWGASWFGVRLDPALLVGPMPRERKPL
jgi:murein DD-endopeptidase MepM/ murein hydrolase activator NlpD